MAKTIEIYAHDLSEEAQKRLCEFYNIKSLDEDNFDLTPIVILEKSKD